MATNSSTTQNQKGNRPYLPPRRGEIKAKIFKSLVKTVVSPFTSNTGREASDAGEASSGSVSPAPNGYYSDGNNEA